MTTNSHHRVVIHFDIDCFYAQVEMLRNPDLRNKPLGIQQKYLLVTCNYKARERGVTKLMSLAEAKMRCPDLTIVNGEDLTNYRNMSQQITDFIQKYTPNVERLGFDENFVDITDLVKDRISAGNFEHMFSGNIFNGQESDEESTCTCGCLHRIQIGSQIASDIREALGHELGITCCAGIAHNKLLAKLVGSVHKPNQQTSILPHLGCQLVSALPGVRAIPGIGHSSERKLKEKGITTVWDLQQVSLSLLEQEFGKSTAKTFSQLALGIDDSPVVPSSLPQTISDEDSFKCCSKLEDAKSRIHQLTTSLVTRLQSDLRIPHTLRLTVRKNNYTKYSKQCSLPPRVFDLLHKEDELESTVSRLQPFLMELFHKLVDVVQPFHLTLINICFAKLVQPTKQRNTITSFFSKEPHKLSSPLLVDRSDVGIKPSSDQGYTPKGKMKSTTMMPTSDDLHFDASEEKEDVNVKIKVAAAIPAFSPSPERVISGNEISHNAICEKSRLVSLSKHVSNQMLLTLQRLLPKHIQAQEILQFPDDIQKEVLSEYGINLRILSNGEKLFTTNRISTRSDKNMTDSSELFSVDSINKKGKDKKRPFCSESEKGESKLASDLNKKNVWESSFPQNKTSHNPPAGDCKIRKVTEGKDCHLTEDIFQKEPLETEGQANEEIENRFQMEDEKFHTMPSGKPNQLCSDLRTQDSIVQLENTTVAFKASSFVSPTVCSKSKRNGGRCPEGFDPGVFYSLPPNIQGELLAHNALGTMNLFMSSDNTNTRELFSSQKQSESKVNGSKKVQQNNLFKYFKKS